MERGRSRAAQQRSDLAGWAACGYCSSHSRWLWGLRLHLITTPSGLPIAYALAEAEEDERGTCLDVIARAQTARPGQTLIADKGYRSAEFEAELNDAGIALIRPATKTEPARPGQKLLRPLRQIIESDHLHPPVEVALQRHHGRTRPGIAARILQRLLALTAAIWHNQTTLLLRASGTFRQRVAELLRTLAITEGRSERDVLRRIMTGPSDVQSVHTHFTSPPGTAPLRDPADAFAAPHAMLSASTESLERPQLVLPSKPPQRTSDLMKRVLAGPDRCGQLRDLASEAPSRADAHGSYGQVIATIRALLYADGRPRSFWPRGGR